MPRLMRSNTLNFPSKSLVKSGSFTNDLQGVSSQLVVQIRGEKISKKPFQKGNPIPDFFSKKSNYKRFKIQQPANEYCGIKSISR